MKNQVFIYFRGSAIDVEGQFLRFDGVVPDLILDKLPSEIDSTKIDNISWKKDVPNECCFYMTDGGVHHFTEDKYNDYIQPYVDLWQAEKDRLEQEQIEAEQEYAKFENRKERALDSIVNDYHNALEKGFVRTSLGFDADISPDSVATLSATNLSLNRNILAEEPPKTVFRDFYGLKRELDKVQVELLICQINAAQNHIRELKYAFKTKVKETHDNDSLNTALDTCVYSTLDFSNLTVEGKPSIMPFEQPSTYVERIDAF